MVLIDRLGCSKMLERCSVIFQKIERRPWYVVGHTGNVQVCARARARAPVCRSVGVYV